MISVDTGKKVGFIGVLVGVVFGFWMMFSKDSVLNYELERAGGADVLFFADPQLPYITYSLLFLEGGADFGSKAGVSALTGALLDQGAGGLESEEIQSQLNFYGTDLKFSLGRQGASLSLSGLSRHRTELWQLLKKIISDPHFDSKEFAVLKKQYRESRLEDFSNPSFVAEEVWRRETLSGPFGAPRDGTLSSLKSISLEDIKNFYREKYQSASPVMTVVGHYDEELKKDILSFFEGEFPSTGKRHKPAPELMGNSSAETLFVTRKDLVQSEMILGHPLVPYPASEPQKAIALSLAGNILGGGLGSRLMLNLRERLGLTYSVSSSFSFNEKYGLFVVEGATQTESTALFLEKALELLKAFWKDGVTEQELSSAKNHLKGRFLRNMETVENRADLFVYYHFQLGLKRNYMDTYISQMDSVSLNDVNRVIREFIRPDQLKTVIYGHPSAFDGKTPVSKQVSFEEYFAKELP